MIKIEMAVEVAAQYPAGRSRERIWMVGSSWPINPEDDTKIIRIEAFGPELEAIGPRFFGGEILKNDAGLVTCRTWRTNDARYVSEQMRIFYQ